MIKKSILLLFVNFSYFGLYKTVIALDFDFGCACVNYHAIQWHLHSRLQNPRTFWPVAGIQALANTGSPRFTDFPSNLAHLNGWEYETNTLRILRNSGRARALNSCHRSEGSWALGTRMWKLLVEYYIFQQALPRSLAVFLEQMGIPREEFIRRYRAHHARASPISAIQHDTSTIYQTSSDVPEYSGGVNTTERKQYVNLTL